MIIVNIKSGSVSPWFAGGDLPVDYVSVPPALLAEYKAGKIKTGKELAQRAIAAKIGDVSGGVAKPMIEIPAESKAAETKAPAETKKEGAKKAEPSPFDAPAFSGAAKMRA